jgi:hypothetical protein
MLRFVQRHPRSLSLLVHHDDDTGRGDLPYDTGAEQALAAASANGFVVVSVKEDWARVFPPPFDAVTHRSVLQNRPDRADPEGQ